MRDDPDELISSLLDNELEPSTALHLMQRAEADQLLQGRLRRYQLVREYLHGRPLPPPRTDFVERIALALKAEPTILAPRRLPGQREVPWKMLALAASLCAVAVSVGYLAQEDRSRKEAAPQLAETGAPTTDADELLVHYLEMHNDLSYSAGTQGSLRYARLVSHAPQ